MLQARFLALVLRCSALVAFAAAVGLPLHATQEVKHMSFIRTEGRKVHRPEVLAMNAKGVLLDAKAMSAKQESTDAAGDGDGDGDGDGAGAGAGAGAGGAGAQIPTLASNEYYPLGTADTNECKSAHHNHIVDRDTCNLAASRTGAHIERWPRSASFEITEEYWDVRPKGCFSEPCKQNTGTCYFYNSEDSPIGPNITGTPVCYAAYYLYGTELTGTPAAGANHGCPDGYVPVLEEHKCRAAADTLAFKPGDDFRVGIEPVRNSTAHHIFPEGCFIATTTGANETDKRLYFNDISEMGAGVPSIPHGIPLCECSASDEGCLAHKAGNATNSTD